MSPKRSTDWTRLIFAIDVVWLCVDYRKSWVRRQGDIWMSCTRNWRGSAISTGMRLRKVEPCSSTLTIRWTIPSSRASRFSPSRLSSLPDRRLGANYNDEAFMAKLKALQPGDSVTIRFTTDFERHRIVALRKNPVQAKPSPKAKQQGGPVKEKD